MLKKRSLKTVEWMSNVKDMRKNVTLLLHRFKSQYFDKASRVAQLSSIFKEKTFVKEVFDFKM